MECYGKTTEKLWNFFSGDLYEPCEIIELQHINFFFKTNVNEMQVCVLKENKQTKKEAMATECFSDKNFLNGIHMMSKTIQ